MATDIERALKQIGAKQKAYRLYRAYYDGDHPLAFATAKFASAFGDLFKEFADNLCPAVVDAVADRLILTDFSVEEGPKRAAKDAWTIWQRNRMDRRAGEVHLEALTEGDAYIVVWPDASGFPTLWPNAAPLMTCQYDEERPGELAWAAKAWRTADGRQRLTMYYPDRIEKYQTRTLSSLNTLGVAGRYERYTVEGETWPLDNPWGVVPVFHFANNAPLGAWGQSELRQVTPLQDALNKAIADMLIAMEFVAWPQRWAVGLEVQYDDDGRPIAPFHGGVDRIWTVADQGTKFGEFAQADLERFLKVQDSFRLEMARVTGTPLHNLMLITNPPSGEALKTLETRFTKKCRDRQTSFGNTWEDALALAVRMLGGKDTKPARLFAKWVDPAPRSEAEELANQKLKQELGVDKRTSLIEIGYGETTVDAMLGAQAVPATGVTQPLE